MFFISITRFYNIPEPQTLPHWWGGRAARFWRAVDGENTRHRVEGAGNTDLPGEHAAPGDVLPRSAGKTARSGDLVDRVRAETSDGGASTLTDAEAGHGQV